MVCRRIAAAWILTAGVVLSLGLESAPAQHHGGEFDCCCRCVDRPRITCARQRGQVAAVVYMRMGENDRIK